MNAGFQVAFPVLVPQFISANVFPSAGWLYLGFIGKKITI